MVIGRTIFGIGCETSNVIQTIFITDWFYDQELNFAMGFAGGVPNFIYFGAGFFAPYMYETGGKGMKGLEYTFIAAIGGVVMGYLMTIVLVCLDKVAEKRDSAIQNPRESALMRHTILSPVRGRSVISRNRTSLRPSMVKEDDDEDDDGLDEYRVDCKSMFSFRFGFWIIAAEFTFAFAL